MENYYLGVNGSARYSAGSEKNSALANILKGYEDFRLDITGKIISSNLEAVNITGYEEWEAIGRNFSLFYTQKDKEAGVPEQDLAKARQDNKLIFSAWLVKKRNVIFWAQVTLICIKEDDGHVTGYRMILKDQTHRLISTNRVKKFRDEYLNLFNNPFIGVFKFRFRDLKLLLVNDKAGQIFGLGKAPKNLAEIFLSASELQAFLDCLKNERKICGLEFQVNKNEETWARIDCMLFDAEGFAEGIITDITANKKQVLELKRLNDELDNFVYHASHDLRSPLTTLMGLINLVEYDTQVALKDYCNMMRERVSYLDELLKDMAAIVFNSKSDVCIEKIDFNDIAQKLIHEFQPQHPHINFRVKLVGSGECYSDRQRVDLIFRNLFLNAIKHYNPHQPSSYLQLNVEVHDESIHILFKDNGKGIKDDQLLSVFTMFYKLGHEVSDTGLGLYITRLMIDKLGGTINVKSKIGEGTEFEIELPNYKTKATVALSPKDVVRKVQ